MNNQTDKTAVVTGANSGIGEAAATELARRGWRVFATARSPQRGRDALARIRKASNSDAVELVDLDLASFASVRRAADDLLDRGDRIDVLINNAGVILSERRLTEDGNESTMQVNHFGGFLLTSLLLPTLLQSDDPRVINVSSVLHDRADQVPLDDLTLEHHWGQVYPYAASKLANVLFTRELHRRYADHHLAAFAVHPGGVRTGFARDGDVKGVMGRVMSFMQRFMLTPEKGAAPVVELAVQAERREQSGKYFHRHELREPSRAALNGDQALGLWDASNEITKAEWRVA